MFQPTFSGIINCYTFLCGVLYILKKCCSIVLTFFMIHFHPIQEDTKYRVNHLDIASAKHMVQFILLKITILNPKT